MPQADRKPTVAEVLALASRYIKAEINKESMFLVETFEEGRIRTRDLHYWAVEMKNTEEGKIASKMLELSMTGRNKVIKSLGL